LKGWDGCYYDGYYRKRRGITFGKGCRQKKCVVFVGWLMVKSVPRSVPFRGYSVPFFNVFERISCIFKLTKKQ